jgi:predicted enzyme involved in methoxymalonyl-ACP biosynthesis
MPKEERARQARLRREREQKAAVDAAVQKALAEERERNEREMGEALEALGITNRYRDNAPIKTRAELAQWRQDQKDAQLSQRLKSGQLTREDLQHATETSPEMQKMQEKVRQLEAREQARMRQAAEQQIQSELAEIRKLNPSVQSIKDVLEMPTGKEFSRLVQERNMTFLEAYKLANQDQMQQMQAVAAQEAAARNYHSKDHMLAIGSRGGEGISVPKGTMDFYHRFRPELTDDQIRADYARQVKGSGTR